MPDELGALLPVYFVADESPSMRESNAIGQVNEGISALFHEMVRNPLASAKVRLTITGFSNIVTEHRSLCDIREDEGIPQLSIENSGTSYRAALTDLLHRIPRDQKLLRGQGYKSHRPAVFFLTDGEPTDSSPWEPIHEQLMNRSTFPASPNIIAFGINDARPETISGLASSPGYGFIAVPGASMGEVMREFIKSLVRSIVQSGTSLAEGGGSLVIRKPDPQYLEVAADIMPDLR